MPAYVISDVTIRDAAGIEIYRTRAAASIAEHGGRYLVRRGKIEVLEGAWAPRLIVMAEFHDMERAPGIALPNTRRRWRSGMKPSRATSSSWRELLPRT